ncbi:MAG: hypothetical protein JKX88_06250 [Marinicaulis sp.]|nr:hypothetical protein [Marinicaulis sp.]
MRFQLFAALAATSVALTGCGGEKEDNGTKTIDASKAKGGEVADVYVANLNSIANAIENVSDEKSAKKAAKAIAAAIVDLEATSKAVEDMSPAKRAMVFATRAQDFVEPQLRISTAMQKIYAENPEYMEIIQAELEKMPEFGG